MSRLLHANLHRFALSRAIAGASNQLANVFMGLLLLKRGMTLWEVCAFYLAYYIIAAVTLYPCARIINRAGVRVGFLLGYIARAAQGILLAIYIVSNAKLVLLPLLVVFTLSGLFLLIAQPLYASKAMNLDSKGRDGARIEIIAQIASSTTSFAAGFLAGIGHIWLGVLAAILAVVAIIPVWNHGHIGNDHSPVQKVSYRFHAPWPDLFASFGWNWQGAIGFWGWAIFTAVIVPHFQIVGIIAGVSSLITYAVLEMTGRHSDSHRQRTLTMIVLAVAMVWVCRVGIVMVSFSHTTAALLSLGTLVAVGTTAYGITGNALYVTWEVILRSKLRERDINYIASIHAAGTAAGIILWGSLAFIAYIDTPRTLFVAMCASAAIAVWFLPLIERRSRQPVV